MSRFVTSEERSLLDRIDRLQAELTAQYGEWYELFSKQASVDPRKLEYDRLVADWKRKFAK